MTLQVFLYWFSVNESLGSKIIASKKEGPHCARRQSRIVTIPDHLGIALILILPVLLCQSGTRCIQGVESKSHLFQRPGRCAIPTCPAAPDILMGIQDDGQAVRAAPLQDFNQIVDVFIIILSRSGVLNGFPCQKSRENCGKSKKNSKCNPRNSRAFLQVMRNRRKVKPMARKRLKCKSASSRGKGLPTKLTLWY